MVEVLLREDAALDQTVLLEEGLAIILHDHCEAREGEPHQLILGRWDIVAVDLDADRGHPLRDLADLEPAVASPAHRIARLGRRPDHQKASLSTPRHADLAHCAVGQDESVGCDRQGKLAVIAREDGGLILRAAQRQAGNAEGLVQEGHIEAIALGVIDRPARLFHGGIDRPHLAGAKQDELAICLGLSS